ncbi:MAG: DUF5335 family protein [Myxococcaceae bacterium]|nr:DUF5335 family protein [Myxococcaceae bacterium]
MDQRTLEIPKEQWPNFLSVIDEQERDKPVRVEFVGPETGDQSAATVVRLRSISAVTKGSAEGSIEMDLGEDAEFDHRVFTPSHVYAVQSTSGMIEYLDIEEANERKTILRFEEPPKLPLVGS